MQRSIRGRTTTMNQRHMPEIPGNKPTLDPTVREAPKGMNYCPLSDPKEDRKREVDVLLQEYTQLRTRLVEVDRRLHQLGINSN